MGAIGGLLGLAGGLGGSGHVNPGFNEGAINTSRAGVENSLGQQDKLVQALQAQGGLGKQTDVYGQFQNVAQGQGPNPAQNMLNQATAANTANQAALMAGQRGAGANAGLMARQAGIQGAANQQGAIGQQATMQANQSLNALGQAGNMANTMAGNQLVGTNAATQAQQAHESALLGAQSQANQAKAGMAGSSMKGAGDLLGGALGGAGGIMGMLGGGGAKQPAMAGQGQDMSMMAAQGGQIPNQGPQSMFARSLASQPMAIGGNVGSALKSGGHVPGEAKVAGNSYANDTVKALLSPGEVVIPRTVMTSKDPVRGAAEFVRSVMAKKGKKA